ncbi:transcriptional regulator [Candidatus Bathyarchaeota archaeon]|nr:transcriptional regulator [Candidatus Bathyarchaeota archaeon]
MNNGKEDTVKTTREEIIELLTGLEEPISIDVIIKSMRDMRPENLVDDINHALKSLKTKGMKFKIHPAVCRKCNFTFKPLKLEVKIPTKCPECKSELINAPIIQKK